MRALGALRGGQADVASAVRHAEAVIAELAPADRIRPIASLARSVLDAVPPGQRHQSAVCSLQARVAAL